MIHSCSDWFPCNGDTVSIVVMVQFNENQYKWSITGFCNGNYIMVAILKFTSNTSILLMIWSNSNYHGNAMVDMKKFTFLTADLP